MKAVKLYLGFFLVASMISCNKKDNASNEDFISMLKDEAYTGEAKATLSPVGSNALPTVDGKGSFSTAKAAGDSVMVVVKVDLTGNEGFTMGVPGEQAGRGWNANFNEGIFTIKENGDIAGNIISGGKEINWDGRLFDDKVMMDVRVTYLQADGNITQGSILTTNLNLSRSGSNPGTGGGNNACEHVVWETRSVFNLYTGLVDLIRVPVCH